MVYYINDDIVTNNCPKRLNNNVLERKADLLYYEKVTEDNINYDDFLNITQFRSSHKKTAKQNTNITEEEEDSDDNEILFIPEENNDNLFTIPYDITLMSNFNEYNFDYIHNSIEKNNIRKVYKYLNGFIETDLNGCPTNDYLAENPKYEKHASLLEQFKKAFNGIQFFVKPSLGEQNASVTMDALKIDREYPYIETVIECGKELFILFQSLLNGKLPKVDVLRKKIVDRISEYVAFTIDDEIIETPQDENYELFALNEKYKWTERCDDLNIDEIVQKIKNQKNIQKKKQKVYHLKKETN